MTDAPRLRFSGDTLLLVEFGDRIDPEVNDRVVRVAGLLDAAGIPGVRDVVPAYAAVGVHFDPLCTDLATLERAVFHAARESGRKPTTAPRRVEIPVCYGGAHGPDLDEVARWAGLTADEVVRHHVGRTYRVYMLGFLPGFAYMAHVDAAIAIPRQRTPRERVLVGSVAIAGEQTGVYPAPSPGGWHVIGRSPVRMFTMETRPVSRCQPGDEVRFVRISAAEFAEQALESDGIGDRW
jgi:KipI family sensor histidine kinase inhibitor